MNIRVCTPVTGKTIEEFISNLQSIEKISDFLELRVDSIEHISIDQVETLFQSKTKPAIFTCRSQEEGGSFLGTEQERRLILQSAIGMFEYVDVELKTVKEQDFTRNEKTKLIISYHNFEETPSYWDMQRIIYEMNLLKPDILKIATMVQKEYEVTKLYRLLTNKPHTEARIVVGMGEQGKITRVIGPLLGSYLTYASTEYGESAPGQIEISELIRMYASMLVSS